MKRNLSLLVLTVLGCSGRTAPPANAPTAEMEAALLPVGAARALRRLGGAHLHGSTRFAAAPTRGVLQGVTTTTDVWLDAAGGYRIVETNDRDGGREIVLHGRTLNLALRYGKMMRRPAEEPEPTRLLEEAVGAPGAAWELLGRFAALDPLPAVEVAGRPTVGFRVSLAATPAAPPPAGLPLRKWRETLAVDRLQGEIRLDQATKAPLHVELRAGYRMTRDGKPMTGEVEVRADVDGIGATPAVAPPDAGDLPERQRTIRDERALLGGLRPRPPAQGKAP